MERTVNDALLNTPFEIRFGDKTFKLRRLAIKPAQEWRRLVIQHDASLETKFTEEGIERFIALSDRGPGMVTDLILAFVEAGSGDRISREEIEAGNDQQLVAAYETLLQVTFPNALDAGTQTLRRVLTSQT